LSNRYPTIIPSAERTQELAQKMRGLLNIVGIEYLVDREKDEHLTKARTAAAQRAALQQEQMKSTMPIDWQAYAQVRKTHSCCFARRLAIHPES
jgi:Ser-tRNA(Ala) deacylase AlaX